MLKLLDELFKTVFRIIIFFAVIGLIIFLTNKQRTEKHPAPAVSSLPMEFRAAEKNNPDLILSVTMKNGYLSINPLVNASYKYELTRVLYFYGETEPCGFEMITTDKSGKQREMTFHRNRPDFHTTNSNKVHYKDADDIDEVRSIVKNAKQNIFCLDFIEL